jgi:hypothetical protein
MSQSKTPPFAELRVDRGLREDELLGMVAAFSGANLDDEHVELLNLKKTRFYESFWVNETDASKVRLPT